jgi:predicted lipoprotein with Yx(FWY)xxD motif
MRSRSSSNSPAGGIAKRSIKRAFAARLYGLLGDTTPAVKIVALATLAVLVAIAVPAVGSGMTTKPPVIKYRDNVFGPILANRSKKALYYWTVEKRAGGKIKCTGACARAWPPLIVHSRSSVPRTIRGIPGRFGTIRRPDGRWQVTHRGLAVYTYAHEKPEQVLCDDVDGWFVVRLR